MKSEKLTYDDPTTGVAVTQWTDYKGHSHHFYFTNPGWYDEGRKLLISSDRNNRTNLYGLDLESGAIEQLTDLEPVALPRELEFIRASKNPVRDEAYFFHDLKLMALDLKTRELRTLHEMEPGWVVSMTNGSADGRYVYFGISEDLSDRIRTDLLRGYVGFEETFRAKPLSRIVRVPSEGGAAETVFEEQYWIGHVNTSPTQPELLTYCHEGPGHLIDNRIWGLNAVTGESWKIRPMVEGELIGHEYWHRDGIHLGYHGHNARREWVLGFLRYDNTEWDEYEFQEKTGHIHSHDQALIVGDGGGVIRLWRREGEGYSAARILCRHDSSSHIQHVHPHPRISPDGQYVVFTSDRTGYGNVYTAPLVEFESLPRAE